MPSNIHVETEYPVALDSPDHLFPWGTSRDNSTNWRFNQKFLELFSQMDRAPKILDLGCSGGGFVQSCLEDGCLSIGLEGSDYSRHHRRAHWPSLDEEFLFTADITKPFTIRQEEHPIQFDLITAWEVMEHLPKDRLPIVATNICNHLHSAGLVILSISPREEIVRGQHLHLTVEQKNWWQDFFASHDLYDMPKYQKYFNSQYIRGPKQNAPGSFHMILSKNPDLAPRLPSLSWKNRALDLWHCSKMQRRLRKALGILR